jgi:hypothetical protein
MEFMALSYPLLPDMLIIGTNLDLPLLTKQDDSSGTDHAWTMLPLQTTFSPRP